MINVCLHDVSAHLSTLLSVAHERVLSLKLGFANKEMMTVSTQNVLGYGGRLDQLLYQQNNMLQYSCDLNSAVRQYRHAV